MAKVATLPHHVFGDTPTEQAESLHDGSIAAVSYPSPHRPDDNQDHGGAVILPDGGCVLVVADGVGGLPSGATASRLAVQAVVDSVSRLEVESLRARIVDGFEHANEAVRGLGVGAGTTLVVAAVQDDLLRTFHVGDSEILVVGQRGKIKLQTVAHSPVAYAVQAGLMDAKEAMVHEDRHVISNMVGDDEMRLEIGSPLKLARFDTVIVASDGLTDNLSTKEIVQMSRKGPLARCAAELQKKARSRMSFPESGQPSKPDDLTFFLRRALKS